MSNQTRTKDLTQEPPRSPGHRLGGWAYLARMIDKGRATIAGKSGEYHFACPADQMLLQFKGVSADVVKAKLASGASDEEFVTWWETQGTPKTKEEVHTFSEGAENFMMIKTPPPQREMFVGECQKLGLDPETTTFVQWLEADDDASFAKGRAQTDAAAATA